MTFNLTSHVAQHPIADEAYMRHLRSSDVFNELQSARDHYDICHEARDAADEDVRQAWDRLEAARAKAALMASMELL